MNDFLTTLAKDGFVPSPEALAAGPAGVPLPSEAKAAHAELEKARVDAFKAEFWSLVPAERQQRWQALLEELTHDTNLREMERLEAGLPLRTPTGEVAAEAMALFLLAPRARAIRRAEWLHQNAHHDEVRSEAAQSPKLQFLDPPLFEALTTRPLASYSIEAITDKDRERHIANVARQAEIQVRRAAREREPKKESLTFFTEWGCGGWVGMMFIFGIIRACISGGGQSSAPPPRPSPPPEIYFDGKNLTIPEPGEPSKGMKELMRLMTPAQIRACESYIPGSGYPPPPFYQVWKMNGGVFKP